MQISMRLLKKAASFCGSMAEGAQGSERSYQRAAAVVAVVAVVVAVIRRGGTQCRIISIGSIQFVFTGLTFELLDLKMCK